MQLVANDAQLSFSHPIITQSKFENFVYLLRIFYFLMFESHWFVLKIIFCGIENDQVV